MADKQALLFWWPNGLGHQRLRCWNRRVNTRRSLPSAELVVLRIAEKWPAFDAGLRRRGLSGSRRLSPLLTKAAAFRPSEATCFCDEERP